MCGQEEEERLERQRMQVLEGDIVLATFACLALVFISIIGHTQVQAEAGGGGAPHTTASLAPAMGVLRHCV
jgi:hypothetical protein